MSLKTLITSIALLAGTSTAALAAPTFTVQASADFRTGGSVDIRDHRTNDWSVIRDHRHHEQPGTIMQPGPLTDDCANIKIGSDDSVYTGQIGAMTPSGWLALTQPTRIERGREFIDLPTNIGRLRTLQLVGNYGNTYVSQVVIEYRNGRTQVVKPNVSLDGRSRSLTISLDNRAVNRVIVYGSSSFGARYSVFAA